jgi:hypothetical protein
MIKKIIANEKLVGQRVCESAARSPLWKSPDEEDLALMFAAHWLLKGWRGVFRCFGKALVA